MLARRGISRSASRLLLVSALAAAASPAPAGPDGPDPDDDLPRLDSVAVAEGQTGDSLRYVGAFEVLLSPRSRLLDVVAWPFERVVQPVVDLAIAPFVPPLEYFFDHDVPQRAFELVSFGEKRNVVAFPYLALGGGSTSRWGATYLQHSVASPRRYSVGLNAEQMVDLDWTADAKFSLLLPGNRARWKTRFHAVGERDRAYYGTDGFKVLHSDSSFSWTNGIYWSIGPFDMGVDAQFAAHRYRTDPDVHAKSFAPYEGIRSEEEKLDRLLAAGLHDDFDEWSFAATIGSDGLESPYAATRGTRWSASARYGVPEDYGEYLLTTVRLEHALLLGRNRYELTRKENRDNKRYLRKFSFDDAVEFLRPSQFRRLYLERKVLVNYVSWKRRFSLGDDPAPFVSRPGLGRHTPLRYYPANRFRGQGALSWTMEYRWPVILKVDGVFFDEYGYVYPGEERFLDGELHNSWGVGVRVRNPDFYFFRAQVAVHGLDGVSFLMTIAPEFWR